MDTDWRGADDRFAAAGTSCRAGMGLDAADVRGNDRCPSGKRFGSNATERLVTFRWQDETCRIPKEWIHLQNGFPPEPTNAGDFFRRALDHF